MYYYLTDFKTPALLSELKKIITYIKPECWLMFVSKYFIDFLLMLHNAIKRKKIFIHHWN
ncbi:hypothetical protein D7L31_23810 [Escherichia coli]|nr:hypothetical protein [Escherichia coli]